MKLIINTKVGGEEEGQYNLHQWALNFKNATLGVYLGCSRSRLFGTPFPGTSPCVDGNR